MDVTPLLGILMYVIGGATGASFYLPFKKVKGWAWESYWLVYAVAGLVVVPWVLALAMSPNVLSVLGATPAKTLLLCYLFGAMWGAGGLTWGLMIRYLGVGLGVAIGCGLASVVGTLVPPLFLGQFQELVDKPGGTSALTAWLVGVAVSLLGIVITGAAGMSKEREMSEAAKKAAVAEFNFSKGIAVAIFSGVMSAGMAFGIQTAKQTIVPLTHSVAPVTPQTWEGLPGLVVVLFGGFTVNIVWCVLLNVKNRTGGDYLKAHAPLAANAILSALAGVLWYSQMVFYTVGDSKIGAFSFSGWSVFMSSQIIFSTFWGMALLEWKGTSPRTQKLLAAGLAVLILSLVVIGYGNSLKPPE